MESDQLQGLGAFMRVVEAGSFTAAARNAGTTPSAVSKSIARLERRLGTRLFQRSTRVSKLTEEGQRYYDEVAPLFSALADAHTVLKPGRAAQGRLRVSLPADLGRMLMELIATRFIPLHSGIKLDISLSDRRVDLLREGYDLALRLGASDDSGLLTQPLGRMAVILVASPAYLAQRSALQAVTDLNAHAHIGYRQAGRTLPITFADGRSLQPTTVLDADAGEAMRAAAIAGLGITQLIRPSVAADISNGRLVEVLHETPLRSLPVQFLHAFGRTVPVRARLFMDFVADALSAWK